MSTFMPRRLAVAVSLTVLSQVSVAQLQLEEIIITAQKRAQSLQDVPISVSAIQGDKLLDSGIGNMSALADHVPNLYISDAPVNTNIYMRGMGSGNNQAFEQSVGMYIDGVYMGRGRQYRSPFLDVERVEVLRGPQGTLFGKNTVAGAISVITKSPSFDEDFTGQIDVEVDTDGGIGTEGFFSGALSDDFAARLAFKYKEADGWAENAFLNQDEPQTEESVLRLTLAWAASDNLDVNFKFTRSDYERTGVASGAVLYIDQAERTANFPNKSAFANIAYLITDTFYSNELARAGEEFTIVKDNGYGLPGKTKPGIGINPEGSDNEVNNAVFTVNYAMGEHSITSITAYSGYSYVDGADVDWLPLQFIARDDDQEFSQFSQEIRIASPAGQFFEYVGGLYYEQSDLEFDRRVTIDTNMAGLVPQVLGVNSLFTLLSGGAYIANQIARNHHYQLDSDSLAAFFQGTINFRDDLRLTLGLRYTEESKDVVSTQFLSDDLTGLNTPSANPVLGSIQATSFNTYAYNYNEDRKIKEWIPSANVQWDVTENSMLYFTWSQGFKSGGFTSADDGNPFDLGVGEFGPYDPTRPADDFEFDDEEVNAFEIGGKHTLLDGAMTLNWAAFHTEYENLQISIFKGVGFGVTNAAETTVEGFEFELLWQALEGLQLGLSGSYLNAEYDSYPTAPCTAIQLDVDALCGAAGGTTNNDLSGSTTTFAPETSGSFFFDYDHSVTDSMAFFVGGDVNYSAEYSTQGDADPLDFAESFTKVNLRFGLRSDEQGWQVTLFGRNIFDEEVRSFGFDIPVLAGSHAAMIDEGAVFGFKGRYSF